VNPCYLHIMGVVWWNSSCEYMHFHALTSISFQ
jgi:hypothetical protein